MENNCIYGVWLQQVLGAGSRKAPALLEYFGSCREIYEADEQELRLSGIVGEKDISRFIDTPLDESEEIIEACERLGYDIKTPDDAEYPDRLRNIPDYPTALYISGSLPDIDNEVCIAIVGTRRASRYGYTTANEIAKDLAACGAIVVSGCARGIDTAAHQGALLSGGKTLAVLGCGINTRYNVENEGLRKVISTSGALISEYPPGSPPLNYHFPVRNRIISALSLGVLVVEAGVRSGSLITANLALEQGKDIFSVPGELSNYLSKGTNRLIFDGAKPIESAADILDEYISKFPHKITSANIMDKNSRVYEKKVRPKWDNEALAEKYNISVDELPVRRENNKSSAGSVKRGKKRPEPDLQSKTPVLRIGMSENAERVLNELTDTPTSFEDLLTRLSMEPSELSRCITELELYSAVAVLPGNKFTKG